MNLWINNWGNLQNITTDVMWITFFLPICWRQFSSLVLLSSRSEIFLSWTLASLLRTSTSPSKARNFFSSSEIFQDTLFSAFGIFSTKLFYFTFYCMIGFWNWQRVTATSHRCAALASLPRVGEDAQIHLLYMIGQWNLRNISCVYSFNQSNHCSLLPPSLPALPSRISWLLYLNFFQNHFPTIVKLWVLF